MNNIVYTIVPETINGEYVGPYKENDVIRASYCYLHGNLEVQNGYDIFSLLKKEITSEFIDDRWLSKDFPEGIYNCVCFHKPCTFFLWNNRHLHGLVVFNDDKEAYEYAKEEFDAKSSSI